VTGDAIRGVEIETFGDGGNANFFRRLHLARRLAYNRDTQRRHDQQRAKKTEKGEFGCHHVLFLRVHKIGFRHVVALDRAPGVDLHDAIDDGHGETIQRARGRCVDKLAVALEG